MKNLFVVNNNGSYFLFMASLYVISPLLCLIVALIYYKKPVSQFFFIAYAFFFGYALGPNLDLMMHYENYLKIMNKSYLGMYTDFETLYIGQEPFHITFKYILSKFHATQRLFGGCACALYTTFVIFFIRQFRYIYQKHLDLCQTLLLLSIVVVVEFYWYFGMRFWSGCFVFMICYCQHVVTGRKLYLYLTPLCMLFHIALAIIVLVAFVSYYLRNKRIFIYLVFSTSFVFRFVHFAFDKWMASLGIVKTFYKSNYQKDFYHKAIAKVTKEQLESGNIVYTNRVPLMIGFSILLFLILNFKNKLFNRQHPQMFAMVLLMVAVSNFGYSDYLFYERFFKFATLLSFSYLFLILDNPLNQWIFKYISIKIVFFIIVILSLAIALFQQRMIISDINLWLGNFFSDISLSEMHNGYKK